MKKTAPIALLLAAALTMSACGSTQNENNNGTPSGSTTEKAPENNSGDNGEENNGENSEEQQPEANQDEAVQALIAQFETDRFTAPDGTEVMLTEATSEVNDFALYFDFAYIRYAEPVYKDTVSNPEIYDFNEFEFKEDPFNELEQNPFKVVKGDVLDNGMKVVDAYYSLIPLDPAHSFENGVELEGECTLEGILFRFPEDDYMFAQDDVLFYPNPTSGVIPTTYDPYVAFAMSGVDLYEEFAFISDGEGISLGDVNSMSVDIADWFKDSSYIRVKVTLDGMRIRYSENFGSQCWSTLKSAEKLD